MLARPWVSTAGLGCRCRCTRAASMCCRSPAPNSSSTVCLGELKRGGRVASGEPAFGYTGLQHYRAGASENSPFLLPRCCALHANHSARPNARLELWPVLRPATHEPRQHMVLVASEPIAAGAEIRIDYEDGNSGDPRPTPRPRPNPNPRPTPRPTPRPNPIPIPSPSPSPSPIALALALALTLSIPKPKP